MRRSLVLLPAALLVTAAAVAGCSPSVYDTTAVPSPGVGESSTPSPSASATTAPPDCGNPVQSYAPSDSVTGKVAEIKRRGRLIAGVSADTLLFGARNPITGKIEGFDISMLEAISTAIFGSPKIEYRVITTAQRIPALTKGDDVDDVDIVARTMTMNCARWNQISFSSQYYTAGQKVLVPLGSPAKGIEDLDGKKVCAPKGSTSIAKLEEFPKVVPVGADTHTGCLVLFQQGQVDAITGDDTVLAGLAAQDPYARVVGEAFTTEPYGLGISKDNPDLVRFVNSVLEKVRDDGAWKQAYNKWLSAALGPAPAPPRPVYGRQP